ncbi:hypothetical protein LINPERPRIM_LOCUS27977 [Linum perenne]
MNFNLGISVTLLTWPSLRALVGIGI